MKTLRIALLLAAVLLLLGGCSATLTSEPLSQQSIAPPTATTSTAAAPAPAGATSTVLPLTTTSTPAGLAARGATAQPTSTPKSPGPIPTATSVPPTASSEAPRQVRITLLYDNTALQPDLAAEWGFAAWIEYGDLTVLFDTGPDGASLLGNMAHLGLDPGEIDIVVLSHMHSDHTGGLLTLLDVGIEPAIYLPAAFPSSFKRLVSARTELVEVDGPVEILPGLHSTGDLGAMVVEQSIVIETSAGSVVVTGCAHPGIRDIVRVAQSLVEGDIALVMGGFHLLDTQVTALRDIVATFREYGVKQVSPIHCTGEPAILKFAEEYAGDYIEGGAGRGYVVGAASGLSEVLATKQLPTSVSVSTPTSEPATEPRPEGLSAGEAATLGSLEMVDGYPLYTMYYYGAYARGASSPRLERVAGTGQTAPVTTWACALFAALADADNRLYGRNFDWEFSPALLLFTHPPDGYASVSMVDIGYLVPAESVRTLDELPLIERRGLLQAPHWPFDGMNEHGLVVGMAAVPPGGMAPDPAQATLGSLGIIRQILDHARNIDEAVAIFESHNVDMAGGPPLHYLLADRSGRSILVEFYQGERVLIPNHEPWHLATNFLLASVGDPAEGQCWRYDRIAQGLSQVGGRLTPPQAMDLLAQAAQGLTQWSVVYGLSTGEILVAMGQNYDTPHPFHLP